MGGGAGEGRGASGPSSPAPPGLLPQTSASAPWWGLAPPLVGVGPPAPAGAGPAPGSGLQAGCADPSLAPLRPRRSGRMEHEDAKEVSRRRREGGGQGLPPLIRLCRAWSSPVGATTSLPRAAHTPHAHTPPLSSLAPAHPVLLAVTWAKHECSGHTLLLSET